MSIHIDVDIGFPCHRLLFSHAKLYFCVCLDTPRASKAKNVTTFKERYIILIVVVMSWQLNWTKYTFMKLKENHAIFLFLMINLAQPFGDSIACYTGHSTSVVSFTKYDHKLQGDIPYISILLTRNNLLQKSSLPYMCGILI